MLGTVTTPAMLRPSALRSGGRLFYCRGMRPLSWIAPGLLLVAIDMRIVAFDMFPDPLGWALIAVGAWQVGRPATVAAIGLAGVASFADVLLPYRWANIDPDTGRIVDDLTAIREGDPEVLIFDRLSGLRLLLVLLAYATAALASWMLLRDLTARARAAGRTSTAKQLGLLRGLVPGLWAGPYLLGAFATLISGGSFDPVWNHELEYLALLGLVPITWFTVIVALERDRAWALPTESARPPRWLRSAHRD
jgi:hypothetical protein